MACSGNPKTEKFAEDVKSAWAEVFPHSRLSVGACTFGAIGVTGYLAESKEEVANGIWQNDMLIYGGFYEDGADKYEEDAAGVMTRPEGSYLAYGSVKLRRVTIKNPTREKLVARFLKLRDFLRKHKDELKDLPFDINKKLGV